jgi:glycosyltransferase involved in cell wall biosynthesis
LAQLHIMHVLFSLGTGGLEKQAVNVINGTDRERFRHSICCLSEIGPLADMLEEPRPRIHLIRKRPGVSLSLPFRIARLLVRERVDVVHSRYFGSYLYSAIAARLTGRRIIYGQHGDLVRLTHKPRVRVAVRLLSRFTDELYSVTRFGQRHLAELTGWPAERIRVLPNGVDCERCAPRDGGAVRAELGIAADAFVVGFVGRLDPVKNLGALFACLPRVTAEVPDTVVVLVGDGPEMANVRRMAAASPKPGAVRLLGDRRDVPRLLNAMSATVLPSSSEGHSNALLEAMASGVPSVASGVGGNPEIVRHGETGFVFPLDRPAELGERLIELGRSCELRERMGRRAREVALAEFSPHAMVARYESLYQRIADRLR